LGVSDGWRVLVGLELEGLGLLPGEDVPAEMSVAGGLLEDRVLQLQVPGAKKRIFDWIGSVVIWTIGSGSLI